MDRANFPVFMKLLVVLLVFAFFPFLVLSLLISWGYDSSFQALIEEASIFAGEKEALRAQLADLEHDLRIRLGFALLVFSSFMLVGVWFGTRFLVRPLARFLEAMRQLEQGDFGRRVDIQTSDEFAILGYYFNNMSKQIEQALRREREVSRMKSEFLSIAAHQLRTPLSVTKWSLNLLVEEGSEGLKKEQRDLLEKGYQANERMIVLVNDLLGTVHIEEGRFDYTFTQGSLTELIEEVFKEMRVRAKNKGITMRLEKEIPLSLEFAFDPGKLRLAFANVINNAIQYTPRKGQIAVSVGQERNTIAVAVRDTGIGIPKLQIGRVFTKFFRADNAVRMQTDGSGLGLFIAKNIIESHGGTISVSSEEGKGSVFVMKFPLGKSRKLREGASRQFIVG